MVVTGTHTCCFFVWGNHLLLQVVIADTVKAHLHERQERLQQIDALRDKVNALAVAFDQRWDDRFNLQMMNLLCCYCLLLLRLAIIPAWLLGSEPQHRCVQMCVLFCWFACCLLAACMLGRGVVCADPSYSHACGTAAVCVPLCCACCASMHCMPCLSRRACCALACCACCACRTAQLRSVQDVNRVSVGMLSLSKALEEGTPVGSHLQVRTYLVGWVFVCLSGGHACWTPPAGKGGVSLCCVLMCNKLCTCRRAGRYAVVSSHGLEMFALCPLDFLLC